MKKLFTMLKGGRSPKLLSLQRRLSALAERYLFEIEYGVPQHETAKAGVLYKDKIRWLRKNVVAPASLLSNSISGENLRWLSPFPDLPVRSTYPAFYSIKQHMKVLVEWSAALAQSVEEYSRQTSGEVAPAARPLTDLKYALAYDLVEIYADTTGDSPSLINRETVEKGRSQTTDGKTLAFVRLAAQIILGDSSAQMLDETRMAIKKCKGTPR
jgi:hypothetical protein